jgi:hypothetical protein
MADMNPPKWGWDYVKPKISATVAQVVDQLALSPQIKLTTVLGPPICRIEARGFNAKTGRELFDHIKNLEADLASANGAVMDLIDQNAEMIKRIAELESDVDRLTDFVREVADWKIEELPQPNLSSPEDELDAVMYSAAAESFIEDAQSLMQGRDDPE